MLGNMPFTVPFIAVYSVYIIHDKKIRINVMKINLLIYYLVNRLVTELLMSLFPNHFGKLIAIIGVIAKDKCFSTVNAINFYRNQTSHRLMT